MGAASDGPQGTSATLGAPPPLSAPPPGAALPSRVLSARTLPGLLTAPFRLTGEPRAAPTRACMEVWPSGCSCGALAGTMPSSLSSVPLAEHTSRPVAPSEAGVWWIAWECVRWLGAPCMGALGCDDGAPTARPVAAACAVWSAASWFGLALCMRQHHVKPDLKQLRLLP